MTGVHSDMTHFQVLIDLWKLMGVPFEMEAAQAGVRTDAPLLTARPVVYLPETLEKRLTTAVSKFTELASAKRWIRYVSFMR